MIIPFSILFIGFSLLLGYLIFHSSYNMVVDSLSEHAQQIGQYIIEKIDAEQYERMLMEGENSSYYKSLREQLNEIREANGIKYLYTMGHKIENGEDQYYYVVDGLPFNHEESSEFGEIEEDAKSEYPNIIIAFETGEPVKGELTDTDEYGATLTTYIPFFNENGSIIGILGIDYDANSIYTHLSNSKRNMFLMTLAISIIGFLFILFFANYLTKPLRALMEKMALVNQGDLTVKVESISNDEIGQLSRAFQQMVKDLQAMISEINETTHKLSQSSIELADGAAITKESAKHITEAMSETARGTSLQTEDTKQIVQLMNHSINQLHNGKTQIDQTVENANESSAHAKKGKENLNHAIDQLADITGTINETADLIRSLAKRAQEVGGIITVISDISEQTNLLALNASIEAARAGEHGKGFSVVANEVRNLAEQSAAAAQHIIQLIGTIQQETELTVQTMEQTLREVESQVQLIQSGGKSLEQIVENVVRTEEDTKNLQAIFLSITCDVQAVMQAITEISRVIEQTSSITEEVVASVEEQTKSIDKMVENSSQLSELSQKLKQQVSKFKV